VYNESPFYEKAADTDGHLYFRRHVTSTEKTHSTMPHFHDSIEIIAVASGSYNVRVDGELRTLSAGEMAFVDSFLTHSTRSSGDATFYAITISSRYFAGVAQLKERTLPTFLEKTEGTDGLISLLETGRIFLNKDVNESVKRGFVELFLGALLSLYPTVERPKRRTAENVREILLYVNEHFREPLTLEGLAHKFGYTENYFSSLFNKFVGMNLREYLNRRRLAEVLALEKKGGDTPLYRMVLEAGFESQNTFYRALKKYGRKEKTS
jgi:AraC-like DNA-binding protein/quercetin dioxygenase-like cupin family protein